MFFHWIRAGISTCWLVVPLGLYVGWLVEHGGAIGSEAVAMLIVAAMLIGTWLGSLAEEYRQDEQRRQDRHCDCTDRAVCRLWSAEGDSED